MDKLVAVDKIPFRINVVNNIHMIWMYCTRQLLTVPLTEPWVLKKTGGGVMKFNQITNEEKIPTEEDCLKAVINFMSSPIVKDQDQTDGLDLLIGKQWEDTCISWVNRRGLQRNVEFYNMGCSKVPINSTSFLLYDSLQGCFKIENTLANSTFTPSKKEALTVCEQVVKLLFSPVERDSLADYTPVRENLFLKDDPCIKQFYRSLRNSTPNSLKRFVIMKYSKRMRNQARSKLKRMKKFRKTRKSRNTLRQKRKNCKNLGLYLCYLGLVLEQKQ